MMNFDQPKTLIKFVCVWVTVTLSGCAMGPDFKEPVVESPESYRIEEMPVETVEDLKWWELFDDPVLYTLVTTALENNLDLKIATARIEQARAFIGFNRADLYPRLDVQGGAFAGNNIIGNARSNTTDTAAFIAAPLSWEIDVWGKFRRATESARAELFASEYGLRSVQLSLVADVVSTYYNLLDFHQRLAIAQNTLKSRQRSLDIIQQRFDKGIIPEIDLNQAEVQKEIAAAQIPLNQRRIAQTENALSILLGHLPKAVETGTDLVKQRIPPNIPTGLPSTLLERRPDVLQTMYLLNAQTANIGVAEALRFPAITLTGALGVASTDLSGISSSGGLWGAGAGLFGPLFNFYKNIRRVDIEKAITKQVLFQYENTVLNAFLEVENALVGIETYKRQIAAVGNQLKAAKNANKLSNVRYDKGYTSYLEVLTTEQSLFRVQLQYSQLKQRYLNAYVNLYKALGGGWMRPEEMGEAKAKVTTQSVVHE
jgi:multidrug efflux system outer membrane protein